MNNAPFVHSVVLKTLLFTETLMKNDGIPWEQAKAGVQKIAQELSDEFPEYASFVRNDVENWIHLQEKGRR